MDVRTRLDDDTLRLLGIIRYLPVRHLPGGHPQKTHGNDGPAEIVKDAIKDALKLAGKIDLHPGEKLVGSDKVAGDFGTARIAVTEIDGRKSVRLGIGDSVFGSRDDEVGPWRAGPDTSGAENSRRAALRREREELEALDSLTPDQERRLEELDDLDTNEVAASGYTANLDEPAIRRLHGEIAAAMAEGAKAQAEFDAHWDKIARLEDKLDDMRLIGAEKWTEKQDARWDEITAQIAALKAQNAPRGDYEVFAEGSVDGEWADVHYRVEYDDPGAIGVQVIVAAIPHESGLSLDDLSGYQQAATFEAADARRFLRLLDKAAST